MTFQVSEIRQDPERRTEPRFSFGSSAIARRLPCRSPARRATAKSGQRPQATDDPLVMAGVGGGDP
jgi:hypothetical protein